jgi:uncharacterized membrane protein (UPF0127 family)
MQVGKMNIINLETDKPLFCEVHWCHTSWRRFLGFQFRRRIRPDEALVLVHKKESIQTSSIHMLFVFTPLAVAWINQQGRVTSVQLARPWRLYYASPEPACYVLEMAPENLGLLQAGDRVGFIP